MYQISVPVMNSNIKPADRERLLREVRRFDAKRVFLALDRYELDPERRARVMASLRENCRFFKEQGFEVGAWVWAFWIKGNTQFQCMRSLNGTEITEFMCPSDPAFLDFACAYVQDVARCGVDLIMFDDDFRYGFLSDSPACLCPNHLRMIGELVGEEVTVQTVRESVISGKRNKYRDAYLQANGDCLRQFASRIRAAADGVNPAVRIGACACLTSWDVDGTDPREISYLLAGKTRPFLRLIGAPYWAVEQNWGNALQDVVELERMESAWTREDGIEIMAEGDVYPRPRTACPASYLEGFDLAIRASGCTDGILKYGIDYHSNPNYETGYADLHERNRESYRAVDRIFGGKRHVGVRVYESMKKLAEHVTPTAVNASLNPEHFIFSRAARALAYHAIPTVYEGEGVCGIVFGENARGLGAHALKNGLILDIAAAEILQERGIDVGLLSIGAPFTPEHEYFKEDDNSVLACGASVYALTLREGAEVLSEAVAGEERRPASYRYENADGNRFLVLNFNTEGLKNGVLKSYGRHRQYTALIPWLGRAALPVCTASASPALYLQCKRDGDRMAVGLWNFYADPVLSPVLLTDGEYTVTDSIGCTAHADGSSVSLSEIPPFGFVAIELVR